MLGDIIENSNRTHSYVFKEKKKPYNEEGFTYNTTWKINMRRGTAFPTILHVRLAETQISLRIRAVWSESSQGALLVAKDRKRLQQADNENWLDCADTQANLSFRWAYMYIQSWRNCCVPAQCMIYIFEPAYDKACNKACVTSKDSDQPVRLPSMARVLVHPTR